VVLNTFFLIPATGLLLYAVRIPRTLGAPHVELAATSVAIAAAAVFATWYLVFAVFTLLSLAGGI
jgi:hypothetical protein